MISRSPDVTYNDFPIPLLDYISPTRPPPTIPLKQVGPQAIPAPVNSPNTDIHDVYAYHSVDEFGNPYSEVTEEIRKGPQGMVNPGASLVPHPVALAALHEAPGMHFVGAPTLPIHESLVFHPSGEKDVEKSTELKKLDGPSDDQDSPTTENMPENVKDDRYQTHFVEIDKDSKGKSMKTFSISHSGLNVGESMGGGASEETHAQAPNNNAEAAKVEQDREHHREEMRASPHDEHHNHDSHVTNELHEPQHRVANDGVHTSHHVDDRNYLDLPSHAHLENSGGLLEKQSLIEAQASERSSVDKNPKKVLRSKNMIKNGNQSSRDLATVAAGEDDQKNIKSIGALFRMFDKASKTISTKIIKNANKIIVNEGQIPYFPKIVQHASSHARSRHDPDDKLVLEPTHKISEVKQLMENLKNLTNKLTSAMLPGGGDNAQSTTGIKKDALKADKLASVKNESKNFEDIGEDDYKKFTDHQKHAFKAWRRQALINFRHRNPEKPIPRNTVSLSDNSLCPKFCRLFCDPWCVKIGCCKLSQEKLNVYKEIERERNSEQGKSAVGAGNH